MKNKNKILYLIHTPPPTHGVSVISNQIYCSKAINKDFNKKLITLQLSNRIKDLRTFSLGKLLKFFRIYLKLLHALLFFRPQLVYFTLMPVGIGFWKDSLLVFLLKLFNIPLVFHLHNRGINTFYKRPNYKWLYHKVFRNCSIIHLSERLLEEEISMFFSDNIDKYVCANGISGFSSPNRQTPQSSFRILFFSNLFLHKGILSALDSAKCLLDRNIDFKLTLAGEPSPEFKILYEAYLLKHPQLKNIISAPGACNGTEKEKLFSEHDIFILPSEFSEECMPLVILEAMSAGLPIIASNIGAISEMVCHATNGYLIEPSQATELADKLEYLSDNIEVRQEMGRQSELIFKNKFTFDKQEEVIRDILMFQKTTQKWS